MIQDNTIDTDVHADFPVVLELHKELQDFLNIDDEHLQAVAPDVSKWSIAKQLEHVLMANDMVTGALKALLNDQLPSATEAKINRIGKAVLTRGAIPRGKAKTPPQFEPSDKPERSKLQTMHDNCTSRYEYLGENLDRIQEMNTGFEHPVMGTLSAPVWIRFLHVHTLHHLNILREIRTALNSDSA